VVLDATLAPTGRAGPHPFAEFERWLKKPKFAAVRFCCMLLI